MADHPGIKAVIWDMGGVVLRTEDFQPREDLAARLGTTRDELETFVFTSPTAVQATLGTIPTSVHYDAIAAHYHLEPEGIKKFADEFWAGDRVDEKLLEAVRGLRPRYRTAMLSNAWDTTRYFLTHVFPCLEPFDIAIFSAEVKLAKPQPEIYLLMLQKLGIEPSESVFIDDFPENIEAANALGMFGIRFHSREQALSDLHRILRET